MNQYKFFPILNKLYQLQPAAWLCGGCVRDIMLDRPFNDMDILVPDNALLLAEELSRQTGCKMVVMDNDILPTARLVFSRELQIDISQWRAPSLAEDLIKRDFTVNSLAWPLKDYLQKKTNIIDPTGGLNDLKRGLLKLSNPASLLDDPLRIMRVFRFMAELKLRPAENLAQAISQALPGLSQVARPRLGQEWLRLMQANDAHIGVAYMDECRVLSLLVPEWEAGRDMQQNPYHHLPVLEHSLASLRAMEQVLSQPEEYLADLAHITKQLEIPVGLLKTACLLHDLGKPATMQPKAAGWNSFHYHDKAGIKLAFKACGRLGLGPRQAETVADLVGGHMLPHFLLGSTIIYPERRRRLLGRFILRHNELLHSLMLMALADDMAGLGPARPEDLEEKLLYVWRDILLIQQTPQLPPPLLNGHLLMQTFGLNGGPFLGRLLKHLRELQLEGEIADQAQALKMAGKWLETHQPPGKNN